MRVAAAFVRTDASLPRSLGDAGRVEALPNRDHAIGGGSSERQGAWPWAVRVFRFFRPHAARRCGDDVMTLGNLRLEHAVELLGVHAEGEAGRIIVSGAPDIPGSSMVDKMNHINTVDDTLLKRCLYEPRGAAQMTVNLLVPPCREDADMGFLPMQPDGAHAMSGSNAICVATALLETGIVAPKGPNTVVRLDTPAGLVEATATWTGNKVERVEIDMPESFVEHLDYPLKVDGLGAIEVDVAFGGCYFALVDAESVGFELVPSEARRLVEFGQRVADAAAEQIAVRHPRMPELDRIEYPMFVSGKGSRIRNATIIAPGRLDRSPCGTGTAARLAVMHERGELDAGDEVLVRSIIDTEFRAHIDGFAAVGGHKAVRPKISGRAWIYGRHTLGLDPNDPFPLGYTLSDMWGTGMTPDLNRARTGPPAASEPGSVRPAGAHSTTRRRQS